MIISRSVLVWMMSLATWLCACTLADSADEIGGGQDATMDGANAGGTGGGLEADGRGDGRTGGQVVSGGSTTGGVPAGLPTAVTDALNVPAEPYRYDDALPSHFQSALVLSQDNSPAFNPMTDAGVTLGRVLFYDTQLSRNATVSCASCHDQDTGFSDTDMLSEGFAGGLTGRNSMGLSNARFYAGVKFFWDERADTLEDQVLMPIQDPVEMGLTLDELMDRVEAQPYYAYLFTEAFGDPEVTTERIAFALAQFVRSIVSYRSRFDMGLTMVNDIQDTFPNYTAEENRGKELFLSGQTACAACHLDSGPPPGGPGAPPALNNQAIFMIRGPVNNGLDATSVDAGLGAVTGNPADDGKFKSPSLRNIALTGPYMHDGRFDTLEDVIAFYNQGIQPHPNLDPRLRDRRTNQPRRMNLSAADQAALVAFLRTLTDEALISDPRYADPFIAD